MSFRRILGGLLIIAVALGSQKSHADKQEAGRLFRAGQQAMDKGEYLTAIRAFAASARVVPHPNTDFAMAQAHRLQYAVDHDHAHVHAAIDLYRRFIVARPRSPWRPTADAHLLQMVAIAARQPTSAPAAPSQPQPTELVVTSPTPGARIFIDGEERGHPSPAIRVVVAGDHRVRVTAPGHETKRRVVRAVKGRLIVAEVALRLKPGRVRVLADPEGSRVFLDGQAVGVTPFESAKVDPGRHAVGVSSRGRRLWSGTLEVKPDQTSVTVASLRRTTQRKAAWATAAGSGGLTLAALVTGLLAVQADASLGTLTTRDNPSRRDHDDELARRDDLALASTVLFSTAAAALVTAALLYWFDGPPAPSAGRRP
jgi:hypothetical protein